MRKGDASPSRTRERNRARSAWWRGRAIRASLAACPLFSRAGGGPEPSKTTARSLRNPGLPPAQGNGKGAGSSFWGTALLTLVATPATAHNYATACIAAARSDPAAALLASRLAERTGHPAPPCGDTHIVIAHPAQVAALLPAPLRAAWAKVRPTRQPAEGFAVRTLSTGKAHALILTAPTVRARTYAAGWFLRSAQRAELNAPPRLDDAPAQAIRATQIGYRYKNNSYDAWDLPRFRRRIEDFALFGANRIQMIAPVSDDAETSPLFPAPPLDTMRGIARIAATYGLDFALYYPLVGDYDKPGATAQELARFAALVKALPRIDALYIPGGDPGHTAPDRLFPIVARAATTLRRRFPRAEVLVSTQGFDAAGLGQFYARLARKPAWLTGIFVGPQTRDPVALHRRRIPARYALELYPDIGHTMHAQFPVPLWHPAFALTQGREPINPRPDGYATLFRHFAGTTRGFVTYSEGVNDDLNQLLWFRYGWQGPPDPQTAVADYARMFVGDPAFAATQFALEGNWTGDPSLNPGIDATLAALDAIRPAPWADWRLDMARYRGVYDALVRCRLARAKDNQATALYALRFAPAVGAEVAAADARFAYGRPDDADTMALRRRLDALADSLWQSVRLQTSVVKYGAANWERGANLDRADVQLNDSTAVERDIAAALILPDEAARRTALAAIGDPWRQRDGALYDDLGDPANEPHLVRGAGFAADPQMYATAIDGIADRLPDDGWRMADISYAETLYDAPIRLHYDGLDRTRRYRLVATYAGEDYALPMRLVANGSIELHAPIPRTTNPMTVEIAIPAKATADGTLDLAWTRPSGIGGGGRGHQVAQVWLIPEAR